MCDAHAQRQPHGLTMSYARRLPVAWLDEQSSAVAERRLLAIGCEVGKVEIELAALAGGQANAKNNVLACLCKSKTRGRSWK
jgi:hypothetical protein